MAALDVKICTLGNCLVVVYLSPECRDDEKKIFSLFNSSHGNLFLHIEQTKNELWKYKTLYRLSGKVFNICFWRTKQLNTRNRVENRESDCGFKTCSRRLRKSKRSPFLSSVREEKNVGRINVFIALRIARLWHISIFFKIISFNCLTDLARLFSVLKVCDFEHRCMILRLLHPQPPLSYKFKL